VSLSKEIIENALTGQLAPTETSFQPRALFACVVKAFADADAAGGLAVHDSPTADMGP